MTASPHRGTVLIVDDDPDCVDAMKVLLEDLGYAVATAGNGREALDYFARGGRACLVVLDLLMPIMSGLEFLAERARIPSIAKTPVIVITATDMHAGAAGEVVLRKPVDFGALVRQVEENCA